MRPSIRPSKLQMLDEGMSRPRCPILTPQTFRSVVGIKGNEFVFKNAFVGVSNDLYVFVVVMKLRHEVSNALLNHLSLRVVIEEDCIRSRMALVVNHLVARSRLSNIFQRHWMVSRSCDGYLRNPLGILDQSGFLDCYWRGFLWL